VIGGSVLGKIFERGESSWIFLDFIEDDEGCLGLDSGVGFDSEAGEEAWNIEIGSEEGCHAFIRLEIDVGDVLIKTSTKFLDEPCFSDLSGTVEDKGFSRKVFFPFLEVR